MLYCCHTAEHLPEHKGPLAASPQPCSEQGNSGCTGRTGLGLSSLHGRCFSCQCCRKVLSRHQSLSAAPSVCAPAAENARGCSSKPTAPSWTDTWRGKDAPGGTRALQTRERPEYTVKASIFTLVNAGYKYFTTTSSIFLTI